jgi:6-phosphogluconolactonase (cycloisomerase 2 family)
MTSFLVCHKKVNRFSPSRNPAEEAPLAGLKEEGRLLPRPWITRTKPSRLGLAQGGGVVRRGWLSVFSTLAIGFVSLAAPLRAQFAYVANSGGGVSAYSIGADGALTQLTSLGSPFAAGNSPFSVAVDPTGRFAYVVNVLDGVSAHSIGANGALTPIGTFPAGTSPRFVAVDPTGKFAYVANFGGTAVGGSVSAYTIDPSTGVLASVPGSPFAAGHPLSVAVDPTGKFAYVANFGGGSSGSNGNVSAYSIGANGALTPIGTFAAGANPDSVAVDPTGKFAYVANRGGTVSAYTINQSTGALTAIGTFTAGSNPEAVAVDPTGKFAYVANGGALPASIGSVSAYSIGADGALTQLTSLGSPFAAGTNPDSVAVDPTGKFAYVANQGGLLTNGNVSAYSIGANGALTQLTSLGSPFTAGTNPRSIAITPPVPFASSFAKLEIAKKGFDLNESFTLGANSNGIDPVTENVTLQIGTFSVTIPGGSFKLNPNGSFAFQGVINGVNMQVLIIPLGNNIFTFNAQGTGVDLTGLTNPVTVVLTIGDDRGRTAVTAQFK